jgi:predicted CxxxxCH...CXXCH cytochrome family protein
MKISRRYFGGFVAIFSVCLVVLGCEFDTLASGVSGPANCDSCHASEDNLDSNFSVDGEVSLGEGAHLAHLEGGDFGNPTPCEECHVVPEDAQSHVDPLPAEATFGPLASANGANPVWDREEGNCSNVYCHGATLSAGSNTTPEWADDDIECGNCHGIPPQDGHVDSTACGMCHGDGYDEESVNLNLHIDGTIQSN